MGFCISTILVLSFVFVFPSNAKESNESDILKRERLQESDVRGESLPADCARTIQTVESKGGSFGSAAWRVLKKDSAIQYFPRVYYAQTHHEEKDYVKAEELIQFYTPEEITTRSIRGVGGVTQGHSPARREFHNILFDFDSYRIKKSSFKQLDEIGKALDVVMRNCLECVFVIEGHTDSVGEREYNLRLSEKRAETVRTYLLERFQVDGSRVKAIGLGEEIPVASNDTEVGRSQNRRVEIIRQ